MATQLMIGLFLCSFTLLMTPSTTFYNAFESDSMAVIDEALEQLEQTKSSTTIQAYKGGLTMKKSNYVTGVGNKLNVFKAGRKLLDAAIERDPSNAEFRFIRLTIQEQAPKILRYNSNIQEDKAILIKGHKELPSSTRTYILNYAKQSKVLQAKDLG